MRVSHLLSSTLQSFAAILVKIFENSLFLPCNLQFFISRIIRPMPSSLGSFASTSHGDDGPKPTPHHHPTSHTSHLTHHALPITYPI
mmetsp:Transcript_15790/g.29840  ORF Transcript_15790/g.29840 Transcript_15790/m.29840 type:complete len:87 (+) Transcript_15790:1034-1294(+)